MNYSIGVNKAVDELVCPITMELPIEPVTAEDGRIYERTAIEEVIKQSQKGLLRSPITNSKMGPNLYPAIQIKNIIEMLVKSGAVDDKSKIEKWNDKIKYEKVVEEMRQKAESGDLDAMHDIGCWYRCGLIVNNAKAWYWFKKASENGHVPSMAEAGLMRLHGIGTDKNEIEGISLIYAAAIGGSDLGAEYIGWFPTEQCRGKEVANKSC